MNTDSPSAAPALRTLYLVDASLYVFRAWHSLPNEFHDDEGWPTNAVHGFARFLLELIERSFDFAGMAALLINVCNALLKIHAGFNRAQHLVARAEHALEELELLRK